VRTGKETEARRGAVASSRTKALTGAAALLLVGTTGLSRPASAGNEFETTALVRACGKWVLELKDFGKEKIRDYNDYVPESFKVTQNRLKPTVDFFFNFPGPGNFLMDFVYPDPTLVPNPQNPTNVNVRRSAVGAFKQKGKKLKLRLNAPGSTPVGIEPLQDAFADLVAFHLLGDRDLVVDVPFVDIRENKVRFKGRVNKDLDEIRMKMKAKLFYDIRFMNQSEVADRFGARGVFKARLKTKDCDD
jgi:hypothetical protein